jgi:hypothetical protein
MLQLSAFTLADQSRICNSPPDSAFLIQAPELGSGPRLIGLLPGSAMASLEVDPGFLVVTRDEIDPEDDADEPPRVLATVEISELLGTMNNGSIEALADWMHAHCTAPWRQRVIERCASIISAVAERSAVHL